MAFAFGTVLGHFPDGQFPEDRSPIDSSPTDSYPMDRSPTRQFPDQTLPRPDISPTDTSPRTDRQFPDGQVPDKTFPRTEISQYFPNCKGNHDAAHYVIAANIAVAGGALLAKTPKMETIRRDVRRQRAVLAAYYR